LIILTRFCIELSFLRKMNSQPTLRTRPRICKFFRKARCNEGDACRYAHENFFLTAVANRAAQQVAARKQSEPHDLHQGVPIQTGRPSPSKTANRLGMHGVQKGQGPCAHDTPAASNHTLGAKTLVLSASTGFSTVDAHMLDLEVETLIVSASTSFSSVDAHLMEAEALSSPSVNVWFEQASDRSTSHAWAVMGDTSEDELGHDQKGAFFCGLRVCGETDQKKWWRHICRHDGCDIHGHQFQKLGSADRAGTNSSRRSLGQHD